MISQKQCENIVHCLGWSFSKNTWDPCEGKRINDASQNFRFIAGEGRSGCVTREIWEIFLYLSSRDIGNPEPPRAGIFRKCFLLGSDSCMICVFFFVFEVFIML